MTRKTRQYYYDIGSHMNIQLYANYAYLSDVFIQLRYVHSIQLFQVNDITTEEQIVELTKLFSTNLWLISWC